MSLKKFMKKKEIKRPKELDYKTGIVVWITRGFEVHASYFDLDNDFMSLLDALQNVANYLKDVEGRDFELTSENSLDEEKLYLDLVKFYREHDCGSFHVVKNEE